jgi:hypothetical protein
MENTTVGDVPIKTKLSHFIPPPDEFHRGLFQIIDEWIEKWGEGINYKAVVMAKDKRNRAAHFMKSCIARSIHCSVYKSKKLISDILVTNHNKAVEYTYNDHFRFLCKREASDPAEYWWYDMYYDLLHEIEYYCADQINKPVKPIEQ